MTASVIKQNVKNLLKSDYGIKSKRLNQVQITNLSQNLVSSYKIIFWFTENEQVQVFTSC